MKILKIKNNREVFWDDYLIDTDKTTAFQRIMNPDKKEPCFIFDVASEKDMAISYTCILKDDAGYKMYYITWKEFEFKPGRCFLSVLESKDGISWTRPHLNMFPHPELIENNVVMDGLTDGVFLFYDDNPACPKTEKYKAITVVHEKKDSGETDGVLWCYTSGDGYHFTKTYRMTSEGVFDSLNTVVWKDGRYACYLRDFHGGDPNVSCSGIRDIRVIYSEDFTKWTKPEMITFDDGKDEPLYTNNIMVYERAPQMFIGFPVRYHERKEWTANNDQIGSSTIKKKVMTDHEKRSGLAATDCIFMCSRDGKLWHRYNEAFLTPGYENEHNWVYGNCYLAYNMVDSGREVYYLYTHERHRSRGYGKPLACYEIRKDGFACIMADSEEKILVTKPLIFEGKDLHINFTTSVCGHIYVDVLDEAGNPLSPKQSFEIYGDTIDRKISFEDGSDFSAFEGKIVRLRFRMQEAKLYALWFK